MPLERRRELSAPGIVALTFATAQTLGNSCDSIGIQFSYRGSIDFKNCPEILTEISAGFYREHCAILPLVATLCVISAHPRVSAVIDSPPRLTAKTQKTQTLRREQTSDQDSIHCAMSRCSEIQSEVNSRYLVNSSCRCIARESPIIRYRTITTSESPQL